jgi:hypothetical protein
MPFTPQDFVSKWKRMTAYEKQTYQEYKSGPWLSVLPAR